MLEFAQEKMYAYITEYMTWGKNLTLTKSWYLYQVVTQDILRMHEEKQVLLEKKKLFVTTLDPIKCLKQIK